MSNKFDRFYNYLKNIFTAVDKLHKQGTIIVYRLWNEQASSNKIVEKLLQKKKF